MIKKIAAPALFLALLAVVSTVMAKPDAVSVFNAAAAKETRKLPIYSVDTDEKKIAISFDAAWGGGI